MKSVAIIPPVADWGVLIASAALQALRKRHGHKISLTLAGVPWCDEALQSILPGRPAVVTMQEMVARSYEVVISLTDSFVHARTASVIGAAGLVSCGPGLRGTSECFDRLLSFYNGEEGDVFDTLSRCLDFDGKVPPMFFPSFDPKMHDRQGVSIKDDALRSAVKSRFFDTGRLWHVPLRKSISKRIEEARTVSALVTDDPVCAWACASGGGRAILLRRRRCMMPSFGAEGLVDEEYVDSYDQHIGA